MKTKSKLKLLLQSNFALPTDKVEVSSPRNDDSHFEINIYSEQFNSLSLIQRNRLVLKLINPLLESKEVHAVSLKLTPLNND
jgi:acid stress-induced BolA-like protein IbaG/YrbA